MVLPNHLPQIAHAGGPYSQLRAEAAPVAQDIAPSQPLSGPRAVQATGASLHSRNDQPLEAHRLPAPLKGLGIPPLNTRQVGDFDRLDDPVPPQPGYATDDATPGPAGLDLRR